MFRNSHIVKVVRSTVVVGVGLLGLIVVVISNAQPAIGAEFFGLGAMPGGDQFVPTVRAVSSDGTTAVGADTGPSGYEWPTRWTYESGISEAFLLPISGNHGQGNAVSGDGELIVGLYGIPLTPFLFSEDSSVVTLPGGVIPEVISSDGSVIAGGSGRGGELVRWIKDDQGQFQVDSLGTAPWMLAGDISNDGSVIVGYTGGDRCQSDCEAFRWTEAAGIVRLGAIMDEGTPDSRAWGVSADGAVVVGQDRTQGQAFRWTQQGGMRSLGMLAGEDHSSRALAVSANGNVVVGQVTQPSSLAGPFIWNAEDGMRRLEEVFVADFGLADQLAGWTIIDAKDISDDGLTIVGNGTNPDGKREPWVAILDPLVISPGDFDMNGDLDSNDIDLLSSEIRLGNTALEFDLNADAVIDNEDRRIWVEVLSMTYFGDANLDGEVDSSDLNDLALNWRNPTETGWSMGDFTGDGNTNAADLNALALNWRRSVTMAVPIPEPSSSVLALFGVAALWRRFN